MLSTLTLYSGAAGSTVYGMNKYYYQFTGDCRNTFSNQTAFQQLVQTPPIGLFESYEVRALHDLLLYL